MVAVEQIKRELEALERATEKLTEEFCPVYAPYLTALGKAIRQQLILASYHLCTQRYPDRFLRLSLNQRQQLQQALQGLGRQAQEQLAEQLTLLQRLGLMEGRDRDEGEPQQAEAQSEEAPTSAVSDDAVKSSTALTSVLSLESAIAFQQPVNPLQLSSLLEKLEHHILEVLQGVSQAGNHLLQKADVLPQSLPEPIFAVAAKAGEVADAIAPGPPNLLSMLVEIPGAEADEEELEDEDEELEKTLKRASVTPLVTVHLRLSEIEFADSTLSAWRSRLRELKGQIETLSRQYRKKQREREIAEAEAAWRSSWYEE